MSAAAYVGFAILLSMFFAWLAVRIIMRSAASRGTGRPSVVVTLLAVGCWAFLSFVTLSLALSTTNTVQTSIIVSNMEGNAPFRAIAAHDQSERARLRSAVSAGLEAGKDGDMRKSVIDSVSAELRPYMNRRLAEAPDSVYLALAPIVADGMRKARSMGSCIVPGDRNGMDLRHHLDAERIMAWSETLISTHSAHEARSTSILALERRRSDLIERYAKTGLPREQVARALTPDAPGIERCAAAATMLDGAVSDSDRRRGADDVRTILAGFELPG